MDITVVNVNTNDDRKWSFEMLTGPMNLLGLWGIHIVMAVYLRSHVNL